MPKDRTIRETVTIVLCNVTSNTYVTSIIYVTSNIRVTGNIKLTFYSIPPFPYRFFYILPSIHYYHPIFKRKSLFL